MAEEKFDGFMKKKRKRTIITKPDLEKLEKLFTEEKWPDRQKKEILAKSIRKTEVFVNTWFQNRRAKLRRLSVSKGDSTDLLDDVEKDNKPTLKLTFHDVSKFDECDGYQASKYPIINEEKKESDPPVCHQRTFKKAKKNQQTPHERLPYSGLPWKRAFQRIIEMVAASEGVLQRSHPLYKDAIRDAALGIRIKHSKLIYNKEYGLDFTDISSMNTRSSKQSK